MPRKIIITGIGLFFFLIAASPILAISNQRGQELKSSITPEQQQLIDEKRQAAEDKINQNYDGFKAALLKRIDKAISRLDAMTQKISSNPKIADASKDVIMASLANTKKGLETYKTKASNSTSLDELKTINQEFIQYLKTNKDVIKESVKKSLTIIGTEMKKKAEAYKVKLEQTLEILKKTCPSETAAITDLENKLAALNKELVALQQAIQTQNSGQIKAVSAQIKATVKETNALLRTIQEKCQF